MEFFNIEMGREVAPVRIANPKDRTGKPILINKPTTYQPDVKVTTLKK